MVDGRRSCGLTQLQAAEAAGVPLRKWLRWEHGVSTPRDGFQAILKALPNTAEHVKAELLPPVLLKEAQADG